MTTLPRDATEGSSSVEISFSLLRLRGVPLKSTLSRTASSEKGKKNISESGEWPWISEDNASAQTNSGIPAATVTAALEIFPLETKKSVPDDWPKFRVLARSAKTGPDDPRVEFSNRAATTTNSPASISAAKET